MAPRRRTVLRVLWLLLLVFVVIGSLLPGDSAPLLLLGKFQLNDKVLHFLAYAGLTLLPATHENRATLLTLLGLVLVLGVLLEFGQYYVSERFFEIPDMAANWCGAICGILTGIPFRP
jgi:VanZ family protein